MKNAILFGSTGFVGSQLLQELLKNDAYNQVIIVVRKPQNITHPKLKILIGDFNTLPLLKADMVVDEIFIALGTTKKRTPNEQEYYKIDHDYPLLAAIIAKENGANSIFIVSSIGANIDSNIFYLKTKGKLEQDIIGLNFKHTHIFQPSMITGNRNENRSGEKIWIKIFQFINPLLFGKLNKYRGFDGKKIAIAINNATENQIEKVKIYNWSEMNDLQ